jgi:hypothetical protein
MRKSERIKTFSEFWPYYLSEHSRSLTRLLHFIGSTLGLAVAVASVVTRRFELLPLTLLTGYGFAWFSHFFVERNRPATFKYPLYSFAADWVMWSKMLIGQGAQLAPKTTKAA